MRRRATETLARRRGLILMLVVIMIDCVPGVMTKVMTRGGRKFPSARAALFLFLRLNLCWTLVNS